MPELMRDPVCGMDVPMREAFASLASGGRWFYFCCPKCTGAFLDTPHRYVDWAGEPAQLRAPHANGAPSSLDQCPFAC